MTRILFAGCLVALFVLTGCVQNSVFVEAVDANWRLIGPEYVQYVNQDPTLDDASKRIRKRTAEMFSALIEQAKIDPTIEEE